MEFAGDFLPLNVGYCFQEQKKKSYALPTFSFSKHPTSFHLASAPLN